MRGEEGAQGRVVEAALHVVLRPFQGTSCPQAQREVNGGGRLWRDHLGHVAQRHPRIGARHVPAVASNGSLLAWKQGDQEALVLLDTGWDCDVEAVVGEDEAVIARRHSVPRERAAGEVVKQLAWAGSRVHVADVVQPDIPGSAHPAERVGETAGGVVLFEDEHARSRDSGKEAGRRERADTRADNDRVIHGNSQN